MCKSSKLHFIFVCYTLAKKVAYVAKLNVAFWLMYLDVAYVAT